MWIIYLVIALAVSTGAGVFMSRDTNVTISDIQRIEAPQIYGEEANRIARYLRRMYQDNPGMFPSRPGNGRPPVVIPANLVNRTLSQGHNAPRGVRFLLQADGTIVAVFSPTTGPTGTLMAETVNRVIERDGGNTDQYNRVDTPNRSRYYTTAQRLPAAAYPTPSNLGNTGIRTTGGGEDAADRGRGENSTVPGGTIDDWDNGVQPNPGGGALPGGNPGTLPVPPGNGGGSGGGGGGGGAAPDGSDRAQDLEPITDFEDLFEGGGTGGSTIIDPNSYLIANGRVSVAPGYETIPGPRANFYSAANLEATVLAARRNQNPLTNRIRPLLFANPGPAGQRTGYETAFDNACRPILATAYNGFEDQFTTYRGVVSAYNTRTNRTSNNDNLEDDFDLLEASFLTASMYCLGVYDARTPPRPIPVRANMAHVQNVAALNMGADIVTGWRGRNGAFMSAVNVPGRIYYTGSGRDEVQEPPQYGPEMAAFKAILAQIVEVHRVMTAYPRS